MRSGTAKTAAMLQCCVAAMMDVADPLRDQQSLFIDALYWKRLEVMMKGVEGVTCAQLIIAQYGRMDGSESIALTRVRTGVACLMSINYFTTLQTCHTNS